MTSPPNSNDGGGTDLSPARRHRVTIPRAIYVATVILTTVGIVVVGFISAGLGPASDAGMGFGILLVVAAGYLGLAGLVIFAIPRRMNTVRSVVAILFSAPAVFLCIALIFWPGS